MKQTKIMSVIVVSFLLLAMTGVLAEEDRGTEIQSGQAIVEAKTSCDVLTNDQLEAVGEYYMELMHPGALHDAMEQVMGLEEGTQEHKDFHIALGERMYCGVSNSSTSTGMRGYYGMMGSGNWGTYSMMSGYGYGYAPSYSFWSFWNISCIIFTALIFAVIFWGVHALISKKKR